jgi:FkbM family methyltransferase
MLQQIKETIKSKLGLGVYHIDRNHNNAIKRLYSQFVSAGDLVFDIGANVGNRIVPLLEIGAKVVAVEPQSKCIQTLGIRFGKRITIVPKGVDQIQGTKHMHISDNTVLSTFSEEWIDKTKGDRFKGNRWNQSAVIEMTTFDELIRQYGKPRFVKIDVEGYEKNVLSSLTASIDFISFEYAVPEQAENHKECLDLLKAINPQAKCNYSVGESMKLAFESWVGIEEMKHHINLDVFTSTQFGDIYVSNVK